MENQIAELERVFEKMSALLDRAAKNATELVSGVVFMKKELERWRPR
jgi:hypothetical protein